MSDKSKKVYKINNEKEYYSFIENLDISSKKWIKMTRWKFIESSSLRLFSDICADHCTGEKILVLTCGEESFVMIYCSTELKQMNREVQGRCTATELKQLLKANRFCYSKGENLYMIELQKGKCLEVWKYPYAIDAIVMSDQEDSCRRNNYGDTETFYIVGTLTKR